MKFIDYIINDKKKILIDSNLSDCNNLIKLFSLNNKLSICNYEIFTINQISKTLTYYLKDINYINNEQSLILFYSFLSNKKESNDLYNLIPASSFSFESAKICLSTINQIRSGKRKEEAENKNIDNLINDYEKYLLNNNYYDDILLTRKAIEVINNEDILFIKKALKIQNDFIIGVLDTCFNKLSYLENTLLLTITSKLNTKLETLEAFTSNDKLDIKAYKTYGFYQEVENVIDIINKNKLSVSDIEIIISDDTYINIIKAYFDNYIIPYAFSSGISIKCFDVYGLIDSIIKFNLNHYSIKYLFDINRNNALSDKYKNFKLLSKLHADKDDIKEILNRYKEEKEWDNYQKKFIYDLLNLSDYKNVNSLYRNLLKLINTYCKKECINPVIDILNNKIKIFELYASLNINDQPFDLINRTFDNVNVLLDKSDVTPIVIKKLSNVNYLIKKHVFILGLSSSQLKLKEVESPLLSDEDISNLIDTNNYYVELPSKRNINLNEKLNRLMKHNPRSNIYLSFSSYDSSEFKPLSSSTFFNRYANKVVEINSVDKFDLSIKEDSKDEKIINDEKFNYLKKRNKFSPSSLNTLYQCPLRYLYSKYYLDITLDEYDNAWLAPNEKGDLAHLVLQNYYNNHKDKNYDEDSFNKVFNEQADLARKNHIFDNDKVIKNELDKIYDTVKRYVKYNGNKDSYLVLGCEIEFKDIKLILNNKPYYFTGRIDRVDYYKPNGIDELHIRIYDYKTGSEKKISEDGLTQSFIYKEAIKEIIKLDSVKQIIGQFDIDKVQYEFYYVYLYQSDSIKLIDETNALINKKANEDQLKLFDQLDNSINSFFNIYHPATTKGSDYKLGRCGYCSFNNECGLKKLLSLNTVWKK